MTDETKPETETTDGSPVIVTPSATAPWGIEIHLAVEDITKAAGVGVRPGGKRSDRERTLLEFGLAGALTIMSDMKRRGVDFGAGLETFDLGETLALAHVVITRDAMNRIAEGATPSAWRQRCGWCCQAVGDDPAEVGKLPERARGAATAHALVCEHNPLVTLLHNVLFAVGVRDTDDRAAAVKVLDSAYETISKWRQEADAHDGR